MKKSKFSIYQIIDRIYFILRCAKKTNEKMLFFYAKAAKQEGFTYETLQKAYYNRTHHSLNFDLCSGIKNVDYFEFVNILK